MNRTTVPLDLQELRLVAAAKAGDKLCYRELLARNEAAAFRAAYLSAGSSAEACAATRRACIEAWGALRRLPATARFGPWLALIAVSEVGDAPREARFTPWTARRMRAELARAAQLERRVEALSVGVEFPVVPAVSAAAISQLPDRAARRPVLDRAERRGIARGRAGRAGVLGVSAVVALVAGGAAIAIASGGHAPSGSPRPALEQLSAPPRPALGHLSVPADRHALGERIALTRARHAAGFTALLPPAPSAAYIGRDVPRGRLSLLAGPELITEFRGTTIPYILTLIGPGAHAALTWVNGRPGVYGLATRTSGAGDVLTWLQGPLTVRIEGAETLEQALALARSLR